MPQQPRDTPPTATFAQAVALHRQGRLGEAERLYRGALAERPRQFELLHWFGLLRLQQGDAGEALALLRAAAEIKPRATEVLPGLAAALAGVGRLDEALGVYQRIAGASPSDADAHYNYGVMLSRLGRLAEGLEAYERTLAIEPGHVPALFSRGNALAMLSRSIEALASYERAIALAPRHVDALNNRADVLKMLQRHDEAIAAYDRVLAIAPGHAGALNNRGNALFALQRFDEAVASLQGALAAKPGDPDVQFNLARALQESGRDEAAIAVFDALIAQAPDHVDARYSRGNSRLKLGRAAEAAADYQEALALAPDHPYAFDSLLRVRLDACDWTEVARLSAEIPRRLVAAKPTIHPFKLLGISSTPAQQLQCARRHVDEKLRNLRISAPTFESRDHDRIRVAYFSADFRVHPTSMLIAQLFELHDRAKFEVAAISFGADDGSEMRSRIVQAVDCFHDVQSRTAREIADFVRASRIDVAVDLQGHTRDARLEIFAFRPAPIQVAYLGYPGTTGAAFVDYVIADPIVLPLAEQPFYSERIVQLPECYQANDRKRAIAPHRPSRRELGLPEQAFVFCCFNDSAKITAEMFDVWMRLLRRVPESVLWLLQGNDLAATNLRGEAAARGIDPDRLIFATFARPAEHLARHAAADLFLDTLPYNAHTTASDALWAGLPLLTCAGTTFAGRVAASLLQAARLPELVTRNLEEYEALALGLAGDPSRLQSLRRKLAENRLACPLFDAQRFRRHIEAAYFTMWDIHRSGQTPRSFRIEPIDA